MVSLLWCYVEKLPIEAMFNLPWTVPGTAVSAVSTAAATISIRYYLLQPKIRVLALIILSVFVPFIVMWANYCILSHIQNQEIHCISPWGHALGTLNLPGIVLRGPLLSITSSTLPFVSWWPASLRGSLLSRTRAQHFHTDLHVAPLHRAFLETHHPQLRTHTEHSVIAAGSGCLSAPQGQ